MRKLGRRVPSTRNKAQSPSCDNREGYTVLELMVLLSPLITDWTQPKQHAHAMRLMGWRKLLL